MEKEEDENSASDDSFVFLRNITPSRSKRNFSLNEKNSIPKNLLKEKSKKDISTSRPLNRTKKAKLSRRKEEIDKTLDSLTKKRDLLLYNSLDSLEKEYKNHDQGIREAKRIKLGSKDKRGKDLDSEYSEDIEESEIDPRTPEANRGKYGFQEFDKKLGTSSGRKKPNQKSESRKLKEKNEISENSFETPEQQKYSKKNFLAGSKDKIREAEYSEDESEDTEFEFNDMNKKSKKSRSPSKKTKREKSGLTNINPSKSYRQLSPPRVRRQALKKYGDKISPVENRSPKREFRVPETRNSGKYHKYCASPDFDKNRRSVSIEKSAKERKNKKKNINEKHKASKTSRSNSPHKEVKEL